MAEIFKFFNSAPGDERWHYASDFADYFGSVLSSGLISNGDSPVGLQVTVNAGTMTTSVAIGKALIKGYSYENTTPLTLTHSIPEQTLDRIDRVVLRLDLKNASRFIKVFVKEGVSALEPVPPSLQRDQYIYELSLAQVRIRKNTSSIVVSDIKDERANESLCGIVQSLITVPTSVFQQQFNAWFTMKKQEFSIKISEWELQKDSDFEYWRTVQQGVFDTWFVSVQNILDGNVAANLANRISTHESELSHIHWLGVAQGGDRLTLTTDKRLYYQNGLGVSFKTINESADVTTININGQGEIPVLESDGEPFKNFKINGVYTVRYSDGNFILQGSSNVSRTTQIGNLIATGGTAGGGKIILSWVNPKDMKFKGVRIMCKIGSYPENENDGIVFYDSNDSQPLSTVTKANFTNAATYFIRAFAYTYKNATRVYTTTKEGAQTHTTVFNSQGIKTFTTSGTFTVPFGVKEVEVFIVGGGGGGGSNPGALGGGGGGGGYTLKKKVSVAELSNINVIVGSGGSGGTSDIPVGKTGGSSSFGVFSAIGGSGGNANIGGSGGSGGGTGGKLGSYPTSGIFYGGSGGSNGSNGYVGDRSSHKALFSTEALGQIESTMDFNGTPYAGGGGGGCYDNYDENIGFGGSGGGSGGYFGNSASPTLNGTANTGGGGGGVNKGTIAGSGGSGIVIIRWGY